MIKNKRTAMVGTLVVAVFISLSILMVPGKAFAAAYYDSYILISGIRGESADKTHLGWIDVWSWSFGETIPSVIGGAVQRVTIQDLKFSMRTNIASPNLSLACARGKRFSEARLEVCKTTTVGLKTSFLSIKLIDVLVSSIEALGNSGSTDLLEKVSLNFARIEIAYTPFDPVSGAAGAIVNGGWDLRTNLGVGSLPPSTPIGPTSGGSAGMYAQPSQAICFINLAGFPGESTNKTHAGWIDVMSWGFGVRPVMPDFRFTMRTNKASPLLFLALPKGVHIPTVILEVYRPGVDTGNANLRITLSDVLISSFLSLSSTGSYPTEEITLKFTKIKIEYTPGGGVVEWGVAPTPIS